jgi:hypothetical protein
LFGPDARGLLLCRCQSRGLLAFSLQSCGLDARRFFLTGDLLPLRLQLCRWQWLLATSLASRNPTTRSPGSEASATSKTGAGVEGAARTVDAGLSDGTTSTTVGSRICAVVT